jgi:hypothetical protein
MLWTKLILHASSESGRHSCKLGVIVTRTRHGDTRFP